MQCRVCKQEKNLEEFLKKDKTQCKECFRSYSKQRRAIYKENPEFVKKEQERQRKWWEANRERGNERQNIYRKTSKVYQISNALRARVKYALIGCVRQDKTFELLGCSPLEWKDYLEKLFSQGMNWENYGVLWEVDHIIPVSHFNLNDLEEQKKAFHYSNTQPLSCAENKRKGNRWIG